MRRSSSWIAAAFIVFALVRVASTHRVFSPTFDEPIHVGAGYQFLTEKKYTTDLEHPPLARAFFALPFRHAHIPPSDDVIIRANDLYQSYGDYMRGVAASRRGNLLFFFLALIALFTWTRDLFGDAIAVVACGIFSMVPSVLAHAGLATTDMPGTAGYAGAMWLLYRWLARTTYAWTIAFGIGTGIACVTKLSFLIFFAVSLTIVLIVQRRLPIAKAFLAFALALLTIWAIHKFDYGKITDVDPPMNWFAKDRSVPAPSYIAGVMELAMHNRRGHPTYFRGVAADNAPHMQYFPTLFAIKTPIPLFILAVAGAWIARKRTEIVLLPIAILVIAMASNINIGVRHILPMYLPLSMLAAVAVVELWRTRTTKWLVAAACAWLVIGSVAAHPDYLPWANAFGGRHPERIVVDSNFDWGQDLVRLRTECRRLHIQTLATFLFGTTDQAMIGLPPTHGVEPFTRQTGWIAVSESAIIPAQARDPVAYQWLTSAYSFRRVGKTIRLYNATD